MPSRLLAGDIPACWRAAARLTKDPDEAKRLREHAKMVAGINAWVRAHGRRPS